MGVWTPGSAATGGNDTYLGDATDETSDGLAGDDGLYGAGGNDYIVGGAGQDHLEGGAGHDTLHGDTVLFTTDTGGPYNDYLDGGDGDDVLAGGYGDDILIGGSGDDQLFTGRADYTAPYHGGVAGSTAGGHDTLDGGAGTDSATIALGDEAGDIVFSLADPTLTYGYRVNGAVVGTITAVESVSFFGGQGSDMITGGGLDDYLGGGGGDDVMSGGGGNDSMDGGPGADVLNGDAGDDRFYGSAGYDQFIGGAGVDSINFGSQTVGITIDMSSIAVQLTSIGSFTLNGVENLEFATRGNDHIIGGDFGRSLNGFDGDDLIEGGAGDDTLIGGSGADILIGGGGIDRISIDAGDTARGGAGDDFYIADDLASLAGIVELAGEGRDTVVARPGSVAPYSAISIESVANVERVTLDSSIALNVTGNSLDNEIIGDFFDNTFYGLGGADRLDGSEGADILYGGTGGDELIGSGGNDTLYGEAGDDLLDGGDGDDRIDGGGGFDTATYASAATGISVSLSTPAPLGDSTAVTDTFISIENLTGSAYSDVLKGDAGVNVLSGGGGPDSLFGEDGNDILKGDDGQDNLLGGMGDDLLDGGADNDVANYSDIGYFTPGNGLGVTVTLGVTGPQDTVGAGIDTLVSIEGLTGSQYGDILTGDAGANVIYGQNGDDVIRGGGGADQLFGQDGDDTIEGGAGQDIMDGGLGSNTISYEHHGNGVGINLATLGWINTGGNVYDYLANFENITGTAFIDTLTGTDGDNVLNGMGGRDFLVGGLGNDTLLGGDGMDDVIYTYVPAGVTVSLAITGGQDTGGAGRDTLSGIENLMGSQFNDLLTGDAGDNVLRGQDGDDILDGGAGNDALIGGLGIDTATYASASAGVTVDLGITVTQATGGSGNDFIGSIENLTGSNFNDTLSGNSGDNVLGGGLGIDTVSYSAASAGVTVSLVLTTAQNTIGAGVDTLSGFENLTGSAFDDALTGDGAINVLDGGLGSDTLFGGAGDDILRDGGETTNRDFLYGGAGNDTYYVTSSLTGPLDLVYEGAAVAGAQGGVNDVDIIHSGGEFFWDYYGVAEQLYVDRAEGTQLVGGTNSQSFFGNVGTDVILAYGGSNRIDAGAGTDVIGLGLYGLDERYNDANTVVMKAGSGIDYVYDFESGKDKIDLTAFHFGITGQQVLDQAVNVDLAGTADDHSYFYLTGAGGVDNYIVFMGLFSSQLQASDFIT